MKCSYFEWTFPNILKLTMFPLLFNHGLPFQNHILDLKVFLFDLPVKCLLNSVLRLLIFVIDFLPFLQWGLDFIGEIDPLSLYQNCWILIAIDYFTKWIEAIPTRQENDSVII